MISTGPYVQVKEVDATGIQTPGDNLKRGEIISIGNDVCNSNLVVNNKVLFDTNKSLKHGGFWYLKADSIFAYDENK